MVTTVDRGDFWEFKARDAQFDLELAKVRATGQALTAAKNKLHDAFAEKLGLDPTRPITLDDEALTATQEDA